MTTGAPTPAYPARPRRSRLRTYLPLGIAVWLVLEIWLLTVVAGAASGFAVFLLLVAGFVLGSVVIKRAGRRAFRNLTETLQQQQSGVPPRAGGGEGNGLMMLGGLLLMIPGLISDTLGLLLLIPPVQKALSR
jgi:Protein affecting phage T7 exclusion by the F plasmid